MLIFFSVSVWASPVWQRVEGAGFVLLTPNKSAEAVAAAREFADFMAVLGAVIEVDTARLPPLTLVALNQGRALRPYRPLSAAGKPQDVAGFFARDAGWAVAIMSDQRNDDFSRHVLLHEGVHWYLSGLEIERPLWVEEGLAEVFATFAHRLGVPALGEPIPEHLWLLKDSGILPVERLVTVTRRDPLYDEASRAGRFYATAWLLTHYLLFGEHEIPREAINTYLNRLRVNPARTEVFREAFGLDYAGMDKGLADYLRRGRFGYYATSSSGSATNLVANRAEPLAVEAALAKVAIAADRYEQAEKHLARVRELAPEGAPLAYELAGHLAAARKDSSAMEQAFARAAELGSRDVGVFYWPAVFAHGAGDSAGAAGGNFTAQDWGRSGDHTQSELRRIANLYKRAINLQPRWRPAYEGLAGILPGIDAVQPADRPFVQQGVALFPDSMWLHYALGVLELRSEDTARAIRRLEAVLERAGQVGETELVTLSRHALADSRFVEAIRGIRDAAESGELATARRLLAELREVGVPMSRRHELINIERNLTVIEAETGERTP